MQIVLYPDPVLRKKAAKVEVFDASLQKTVRDMFATMYKLRGVGLAAPQVGLSINLLVLNPSGDPEKPEQEMALINPKIRSRKGEVFGEEGCLSFPRIYAEIARARDIVVDYQDPSGKKFEGVSLSDYLARIVQHEGDHLDGVLFTDRMSPADKSRVRGDLKALETRFEEARAGHS